ncbi:MAG: GNAT family N-acetyltransferase [Candidatus Acinetobacter avistercoris]|uniref:GNAT family N-acetyltransferase n=1 Tax=Acinetobacter sp. KS-LM10 TaxID=3120518 RepID=UPI001F9446F7|nr:GNAT family N-acetyltransferase [Candidatus Acinetobacter avistercoris]
MQDFDFRLAEERDIPDLALLINRAYREDHKKSWSNESRFVAGDRINHAQLKDLIVPDLKQRNNSRLIVAEFNTDDHTEIFGCILIEFNQNTAEIGTFCIAPTWQNLNYGHKLLSKAEMYALKTNPDLYSYEM